MHPHLSGNMSHLRVRFQLYLETSRLEDFESPLHLNRVVLRHQQQPVIGATVLAEALEICFFQQRLVMMVIK